MQQNKDLFISRKGDYNCVRPQIVFPKTSQAKCFTTMPRLLLQNKTIHWKKWKLRSWLGRFSDSELPVLTMEWLQLWTFRTYLNVLVSCRVVFVLVWETPKLCPLSSVFPCEIPSNLAIAHKWAIVHLGSSCHPKKLHETPPFLKPDDQQPVLKLLLNYKEKWGKKKSCWWHLVTWVRFCIPIPIFQEVH